MSKISSRKILVVKYDPPEAIYKIPLGVDLKNNKQIKQFWVRWGILYIEYVDGFIQKQNPCLELNPELHHPNFISINDADEYDIEFSDNDDNYDNDDNDNNDANDKKHELIPENVPLPLSRTNTI